MRVLLVDDEASAIDLVGDELAAIASGGLVVCGSLDEAFSALVDSVYDCAILDLSLPDGWGLDTLLQFRRRAKDLPVLVLSGSQGEPFEQKALRAGAHTFLRKGQLVPGDLAQAAADAVAAARAGQMPQDAVQELAELAKSKTPVSARMFGSGDLREVYAGRFDALVDSYVDLLELALERTAFDGILGVGDHLRDLASSMGAAGAGPRDVVQLHAEALRKITETRQGAGTPNLVQEARLVVLELMGYLVSHYRTQAFGRPVVDGSGT